MMAKMFYTIEEVCQKLGKTPDEISNMVTSREIQEFRDGENLIFKVEQIDLLCESEDSGEIELNLSQHGVPGDQGGSELDMNLASGERSAFNLDSPAATGASGMIDLTGSATGISHDPAPSPAEPTAAGSGTGSGLSFDLTSSATGISAFGGGSVDEASGETQLGDDFDDDLTLESVGSGSGLLDLTRESDDTSLGAELLEEVYSGEDEFELPANASGLFEVVAPETDAAAAPAVVVAGGVSATMMEAYDGSGSGLGIGLLIGATVALIAIVVILASELQSSTSMLTNAISGNLWMWTGGLAALAIVAGGVGVFIGRASQ